MKFTLVLLVALVAVYSVTAVPDVEGKPDGEVPAPEPRISCNIPGGCAAHCFLTGHGSGHCKNGVCYCNN